MTVMSFAFAPSLNMSGKVGTVGSERCTESRGQVSKSQLALRARPRNACAAVVRASKDKTSESEKEVSKRRNLVVVGGRGYVHMHDFDEVLLD